MLARQAAAVSLNDARRMCVTAITRQCFPRMIGFRVTLSRDPCGRLFIREGSVPQIVGSRSSDCLHNGNQKFTLEDL